MCTCIYSSYWFLVWFCQNGNNFQAKNLICSNLIYVEINNGKWGNAGINIIFFSLYKLHSSLFLFYTKIRSGMIMFLGCYNQEKFSFLVTREYVILREFVKTWEYTYLVESGITYCAQPFCSQTSWNIFYAYSTFFWILYFWPFLHHLRSDVE